MTLPLSAAEIADDIIRRIGTGEFERGAPLPSLRELATFYGAGRTKITIAVVILRERGIVETKPGRAVYVRDDGQSANPA